MDLRALTGQFQARQDEEAIRLALGGMTGVSLALTREVEAIRKLYQSPALEAMRSLEQASRTWHDSIAQALEPMRGLSKVIAESTYGLAANLHRELGLVSRVLQENAFSKAVAAIQADQRQWATLQGDFGISKAVESITQANRQWTDLAKLAGIGPHIPKGTFDSVIALQRSLATMADFPLAPAFDTGSSGVDSVGTVSPDEVQSAVREALRTELPPLLAGLHSRPPARDLFWILISILLVLERVLSLSGSLASIDGWRLTRFGAPGASAQPLSPEEIRHLHESMEAVLALGQFMAGSDRQVVREVRLYKAPGGVPLGRRIPPGTMVRVLKERHEWIAVGFEGGDEWISGWVLKKYTAMQTGPNEALGHPSSRVGK